MATIYLDPSDVTPAQAERVLAFINAARTPREIAERVEFPDERDVGLGVARRILDARARLGGTFRDVRQLADVPYVGPERFTEIVVALTGMRLAIQTRSDLERELETLRARVLAFEPGPDALRLEIRTIVERRYLGQALSLVVRATRGPEAERVPGTFITLVSTFGALVSRDGFGLQRGSSITLSTDIEGNAHATLVPVTREPVRPEQQTALLHFLDALPAQAATPREARAGLDALAARYRLPQSGALRTAVDIYYRSFAESQFEGSNAADPLAVWPLENATVMAFAHAQPAASSPVSAAALIHHGFNNWLFAWLARYSDAANEAGVALTKELSGLFEKGKTAGFLSSTAYGRVQRHLEGQPGVVGKLFGQRVAEQALRNVLDGGLERLPVDARLALRQSLTTASASVGSAEGLRLLRGFGNAQAEVRTRTRDLDVDVRGQLGTLSAQFTEMGRSFDSVSRGLSALDQRVGRTLPTLETQLSETRTALLAVQTALATKIDRGQLDKVESRLGSLQTELAAKVDGTQFSAFRERLDGDLGALGRDITELRRR